MNLALETLRQALACHQRGRLADAEPLYRRAIELDPGQHDAWRLLGVLFHQQGHLELARQFLDRALQTPPVSVEALEALASVYEALGRISDSIACCQKAHELRPDDANILLRLALVQESQGQLREAESCLRKLLDLDPSSALAHLKLATVLESLEKLNEAQSHAELAIRFAPDSPEPYLCLGTILIRRNRISDSVPHFNHAVQLDPVASACAIGTLREILNEGTRNWESCLASNPADFDALLSLAKIRYSERRPLEAIELLNRALAVRPGEPNAEYALGFTELLLGRFESGWQHYEARLRTGQREFPNRKFAQPLWTGENLAGRTILVHAEQGIGDTIQFIRYLPWIAERGGRIVLECQPPLKPLLQSLPYVQALVAQGELLPPFDVQAPLLSLPAIFRTTLESIHRQTPYLKVPEGARSELPDAARAGLKVGIVWAGNPVLQNDLVRSLPLSKLAPLLVLPDISFFSLQVGPAARQIASIENGKRLIDLGPLLSNFAQTACVIQQLDLVIGVDTAVAHLAGALAKPTWLMLPFAPEWRWLLDREDSPWYPSMRLFRQPAPEDWDSVVRRLKAALQREIGS